MWVDTRQERRKQKSCTSSSASTLRTWSTWRSGWQNSKVPKRHKRYLKPEICTILYYQWLTLKRIKTRNLKRTGREDKCHHQGSHRTISETKFDIMKMSNLIRLLIFVVIYASCYIIAINIGI